MDISQLTIDPEFAGCQRRLTPDEFEQLKKNIIADGEVLSPIVVWQGTTIVIEGMHRKLVVDENPSIPFTVKEKHFDSRDDVKDWIANHQTGRRNLDGIALTMQRAKAFRMNKDADQVAQQFGVTRRTVYRDEEVQQALEMLPEELQARIKQGALPVAPADLRRFAKLSEIERTKVVDDLKADSSKMFNEAMTPAAKKTTLTDDDMGVVAQTFSPAVNRKISNGTIHATHSEIQRVAKLEPATREAIDDMLLSGEVTSMSEGLDVVAAITKKPKRLKAVDLDALKTKTMDLFEKLVRSVDDMARESGKPADTCLDQLRLAMSNLPY